MTNEECMREYKTRIRRVIDHIENNVCEKLPPGVLAEASGFSPYHFERIFHAFVGETPGDFVNRIRLEKAASRLITYPSEQITVVASMSGFPSSSAFAKAFREHFGCSAREWRSGRLDGLLKDTGRMGEVRKVEALASASDHDDQNGMKSFGDEIAETIRAEIKQMPSFRVAYLVRQDVRHRKVERLFEAFRRWAAPRGLLMPETKMIGICLDSPEAIAQQKRRCYACLTVSAELEPEPGIAVTDIPASRSAVLHFEGDTDGITRACDWMFGKFIPENGCEPADRPSYDIYYGSSDNHDKKLSLDICIPVETMET